MSRSRKRSPAGGITTARSDKAWKRIAARRMRAAERVALSSGSDVPDRRVIDSVWNWAKDGRHWFGAEWAKEVPSIIRK